MSTSPKHNAQTWVLSVWVVLLVLALYPFTADPAEPVKHLVTASAVAALGLLSLWRGSSLATAPALQVFLLFFLAAQIISVFFAQQPLLGVAPTMRWLMFSLLTLFVAGVCNTAERVTAVLRVAVLAVAASSVYGLCQWVGLDPFPWSTRGVEEYLALPSTYGNPNFAGHALVLAVILAAGLGTRPGQRWLYLPGALIALHLYLTHMRAARLAIAAAVCLLVLVLLVRTRKWTPLKSTAAVIAVTAVAVAAGVLAVATFLGQGGTGISLDSSLTLRLNGYLTAARMFLDSPLTGAGAGNYLAAAPAYWTPFEAAWLAEAGQRQHHAHNDLLEFGAEGGIFGAAAYLALLLSGILAGLWLAFGKEREMARLGLMLACALSAFLVDGNFGFNLLVPVSAGLCFLLLGCAHGLLAQHYEVTSVPKGHGVALFVCCIALFCFFTFVFIAETQFQRAEGAQHWGAEYQAAGDSAGAEAQWAAGYTLLQKVHVPWDPKFARSSGTLALHLQEPDAALAHFEAALALAPHDPQLLLALAQAHLQAAQLGNAEQANMQLEQASTAARAALERAPRLADAWAALGRVAWQRHVRSPEDEAQSHATEARDAFGKALMLMPRHLPEVQRGLVEAHLALGAPEEARTVLAAAILESPADVRLLRLVQQAAPVPDAVMQDALSAALQTLRAAEPVPAEALGLATVALARQYETEHPQVARRLVAITVPSAPGLLSLWLKVGTGQPEEERLQEVGELVRGLGGAVREQVPELMQSLARLQTGDAATALDSAAAMAAALTSPDVQAADVVWVSEAVESAVRLLPDSTEKGQAFLEAAVVQNAAGLHEQALHLVDAALPLLPASARALAVVQRSRALAGLGRSQEAMAAAQEAVQLSTGDPIVRLNLARRLAEAGRTAEARLEYMGVLQRLRAQNPLAMEAKQELDALEPRP